MGIPILYIDNDLLAVDKPAGMAVNPGGWTKEESSLRSLLEGENGRLWTIHRLDKVTSGVVVFARNASAHRTLSMLFEKRLVAKTYQAILCGEPDWRKKTACHPLRVDAGRTHRTAVDHKNGTQAVTHFRILERNSGYALAEIHPETGRTHQIRAHAACLGHPILADRFYGALPTDLIDRPALHASSLEFTFEGSSFFLEAPSPDDLVSAWNKIRAG